MASKQRKEWIEEFKTEHRSPIWTIVTIIFVVDALFVLSLIF